MKSPYLQMAIGVILAAVSCLPARPQGGSWLSYEPTVVELQGKLILETKFGPPNYGENPKIDKKLKIPILLLPQAVKVRGNPDDPLNSESVERVERIQLVFTDRQQFQEFIGKRVTVKGALFHSHSGHHFTKVLMNVQEGSLKLTKGIGGGSLDGGVPPGGAPFVSSERLTLRVPRPSVWESGRP